MSVFTVFTIWNKVVAKKDEILAAAAGAVVAVGETKAGKVFGRKITLIINARVD